MENNAKAKRKSPAHIAWLKKKNAMKNKKRGDGNPQQRQGTPSREKVLPPRESFRLVDICPSPEELQGSVATPVRRNLVEGAYHDAEDYLDLQFRLLREDFVRPLREGLNEVRERDDSDSEDAPPLRNLRNGMKVYRKVRFERLARDNDDLCLLVKIDPDQLNLANEKLFMFGSLLCFSLTEDRFSNVILAKVTASYPSLLRKGNIKVALINSDEILDLTLGASYSMVESEVFFEPYYRVLTALQTMALHKFPMCDYVTGRATTVKTINQMRLTADNNPGLNVTQFKAYCMALMNNLTLIQGPPGTGKTHLGLKVVQRMIELNEELERVSGERPPPILVICATNHALDQFLEHIVGFNTDVIRVGNQSQSTILTQYLLSAKRKKYRHTNKEVGRLMVEIEFTLNKLRMDINTKLTQLNAGKLSMDEQTSLEDRILLLIDKFEEHSLEYQGCKLEKDLVVMRDARLIGMTTTSAARLRPLLDNLKPSIMIVEEAAEVLEAHIVGALTKHCRHVILIGDHQQLRPITSCYRLSKDYHLDISLFERLCKNRVPFITLDTQHRMRPEFAKLLVPTVYAQLKNDSSVLNRPSIRGVEKNMFFVNHFKYEEAAGWSRKNLHEANFLMALCRYLILQGYAPNKITIIAMYAAQVTELENLRSCQRGLNDVVISSVDGYQGEENDIVLLSLVRSNQKAQIGFLWTVNRVCVALSRARCGLYIIGNMENLTRDRRSVWCRINTAMTQKQAVGTHLSLRCAVHGAPVPVSSADDFSFDEPDVACPLGCGRAKPRPAGSLESLLDSVTLDDRRALSTVFTNGNLGKSASMQDILDVLDRKSGKSRPIGVAAKPADQGLPTNGNQKRAVKPTSQVTPTKAKHFFSADFEPEAPLKPHAAVTPFQAQASGRHGAEPLTNGAGVGLDFSKLSTSDEPYQGSSGILSEMEEFDRQTRLKRDELLARVLALSETDKNSKPTKNNEVVIEHPRKFQEYLRNLQEQRNPAASETHTTRRGAPMNAEEYLNMLQSRSSREGQVASTGSRHEIRPTPSVNPLAMGDSVCTGAVPRTRLAGQDRLLPRPQAPPIPVAPMPVARSHVIPLSLQSAYNNQAIPLASVATAPVPVRPLGVSQNSQVGGTQVEVGHEALLIGEHRRHWPHVTLPDVEAKKKKKSTCRLM